jgi:hypothetical protein
MPDNTGDRIAGPFGDADNSSVLPAHPYALFHRERDNVQKNYDMVFNYSGWFDAHFCLHR